jgi:hypothetical protein
MEVAETTVMDVAIFLAAHLDQRPRRVWASKVIEVIEVIEVIGVIEVIEVIEVIGVIEVIEGDRGVRRHRLHLELPRSRAVRMGRRRSILRECSIRSAIP